MKIIDFVQDFEKKMIKRKMPFVKLDFIHGYLTGIAIAPKLIEPTQWLNVLFENAIKFRNRNDSEFFISFLFELYNRVLDDLDNEEIITLLADVEDENGAQTSAKDWCRGLFFATDFYKDEFFQYMEKDDDNAIDLLILSYLAEFDPTDEKLLKDVLTDWNSDKLTFVDSIPDMVFNMYSFFQEIYADDDYDGEKLEEETKSIKKAVPKVGRNDPCPCGSGKKYKHCCGKNV